jgi:hypothetical protein
VSDEARATADEEESRRRHHVLFLALVGGGALLASAIFANNWLQRAWLAKKWLFRSHQGLTLLGVFAAVACLAFAGLALLSRKGAWRSTSYAPLAWVLPVVAVAWMLTWTIEPPTLVYDAQLALCGAIAAWCALVLLAAPSVKVGRRGFVRVLDVLACELAAVLILAEVGLRVVRGATDSSWLATASTGPTAWLRAHRLAPGAFFMGFRVNREGFVDVEPEKVLEKPHRVVCIGDSFSVGVVPHHLHYTTVAEAFFRDLEVYDAGVVNSGPREYLEMLRASALPLHPELVVIGLFLGNDIVDAQRKRSDLVGTWTDRNEVLIVQVLRRLAAFRRERSAGGTVADPTGSTATAGLTGGGEFSAEEAERRMAWLRDPMLEMPGVSAERFLYVEWTRTGILRAEAKDGYRPAFEYLEKMRDLAHPVPIACLLIPDEYQVEDRLWEELRSQTDLAGMDRDQPQELVSAWLESEKIPFVDLLPRLRAVPPLADGKHHVYHLQDTHFNARGNRIAGEALAELIEGAGVAKRKPADSGSR